MSEQVLCGTLRSAGFASVGTVSRGRAPFFDLWALAIVSVGTEDEMRQLAGEHFPR